MIPSSCPLEVTTIGVSCSHLTAEGLTLLLALQVLRDVKHFVKDYRGEEALAVQGAALAPLLCALSLGCKCTCGARAV